MFALTAGMQRGSFLLVTLLSCVWAGSAFGQAKAGAHTQGVVDVVQLKSGRSLRGAIAWRDPNGTLTIAVSKEWLRTANPNLYRDALQDNLDQRLAAWTNTSSRIEEWQKNDKPAAQLDFFLKQEKDRLSQLIAKPAPDEPGFLWFDVVETKVTRILKATPDQAQLALFAWNEALQQVETRDEKSLAKELKAKGIKLDGPRPELTDWLSSRPQSDAEWATRRALVEYTLGTPVDFQGSTGTFVRTGDGQTVKLAEILPQVLQSQLNTLLKELTPNPQQPQQNQQLPMKSLIQQAETAKAMGFRVTEVQVDSTAYRATVDARFVVQISPGTWRTTWRQTVTEDGTKARPQVEARIEQDPQIKSATDAIKSLGIANPAALQQAIRFGAATMAAQEAVDSAFAEFRQRYTRQLDGPPMRLNLSE